MGTIRQRIVIGAILMAIGGLLDDFTEMNTTSFLIIMIGAVLLVFTLINDYVK